MARPGPGVRWAGLGLRRPQQRGQQHGRQVRPQGLQNKPDDRSGDRVVEKVLSQRGLAFFRLSARPVAGLARVHPIAFRPIDLQPFYFFNQSCQSRMIMRIELLVCRRVYKM